MSIRVPASELRLADVVLLENVTAYNVATVKGIHPYKGTITMFRPYTITSDFSMGGDDDGDTIICYVGFEMWSFAPRVGETFEVLERKHIK